MANEVKKTKLSFGGYAKSLLVEDSLAVAFNGCVLVASAGNDARPNVPQPTVPGIDMYPAAFPWVIGVMASDGTNLAGFSNFDYLPEDSVAFENVTDEWLMKLSSKDIRIIIKLMLKQKR